jgi:glycosyltransferase involved in cell wall biosynthesis
MKIAFIASSQVPSTTANSIQVMKVCQSAAALGHEARLWVPGSSDTPWATLQSHYGLSHSFDIQWQPTQQILKRYDLAITAINQAIAWKADLVYTWLPQAAVLALMRHVPAILEVHDLPSGRMGPHLFKQFLRQRGRKRLLAITQALYDRLRAEYHFNLGDHEYRIAPNGADLERYKGLPDPVEARKILGLRDGLTVGYTGHFYSGRGMDLLLKLIPSLPELNFLFVGGQPEKVITWRAHMQQSNYNNVQTTGFIDSLQLPLYQAAADILLMPYEQVIAGSSGGNSAEICSPMKMFDYMAAGRAILTSDLPVLHEVLNQANAMFCAPNDVEGWRSSLLRLAGDADLRQRLGTQAKRDAERYSWNARARNALDGFIEET